MAPHSGLCEQAPTYRPDREAHGSVRGRAYKRACERHRIGRSTERGCGPWDRACCHSKGRSRNQAANERARPAEDVCHTMCEPAPMKVAGNVRSPHCKTEGPSSSSQSTITVKPPVSPSTTTFIPFLFYRHVGQSFIREHRYRAKVSWIFEVHPSAIADHSR